MKPGILRAPLPWFVSVALLSIACWGASFVCLAGAAHGWPQESVWPTAVTLVYVLGLDPFFMRRNHVFDLHGLAWIAIVGIGVSALSWLFRANVVVLTWFGMTYALMAVARTTEQGRMIEQQIELEKATYSNPPTGQKERMLFVGDFMLVLFTVILLLFARETLALEPTPPPRKPTTTANELHDAMLNTIIRHRQNIYVSSREWAQYCETYRGQDHKDWCAQDLEKVRAGESAAHVLIAKLDRNSPEFRRGFSVLYMGTEMQGMSEGQERAWLDANPWFRILAHFLVNLSQDDLDCGKSYACTAIMRFNTASCQLIGVELLKHQ